MFVFLFSVALYKVCNALCVLSSESYEIICESAYNSVLIIVLSLT